MSDVPAAVVAKILERAYDDVLGALVCEACLHPISGGYAKHHRHAKRMGGTRLPWIDTASNLMVVHADLARNCHNLTEYSIHQNPDRSRRLGHIVPYGTDPATVPVVGEPRLRELRA